MARRVRVTSLELSEESYGDCASGRGQKEDPPRRDAQPGGHTCDDECGEDSENEDHPSHFHSMIAIRCHSKPAMSRITGLAATVSPSLRTGPGRHQTFLSRFRQNATTTHRHKQSELLGRTASFASGPSRRAPLRRPLSAGPPPKPRARRPSDPGPRVAPRARIRGLANEPAMTATVLSKTPSLEGRSCTSGWRSAAANTPNVRPAGSTSSSGGPAWLNRKLCTAVDGRRASPSGQLRRPSTS
jgi:hypothetical protein